MKRVSAPRAAQPTGQVPLAECVKDFGYYSTPLLGLGLIFRKWQTKELVCLGGFFPQQSAHLTCPLFWHFRRASNKFPNQLTLKHSCRSLP
jgi:hypothetical protein